MDIERYNFLNEVNQENKMKKEKQQNLFIHRIKSALSPFNRGEDVFVCKADEARKDQYQFALFFSLKAMLNYSDGYDSEDIVIWQIESGDNKGKWGFSFNVHDPGVRYHKDGSGTPPSDELVEHKEIYTTIQMCVEGIAKHMMNHRIAEMKEALSFVYSHFPEE
jgi:hypothetical protein